MRDPAADVRLKLQAAQIGIKAAAAANVAAAAELERSTTTIQRFISDGSKGCRRKQKRNIEQ